MELTRQKPIIDISKVTDEIHIIGGGATGSNVALSLVKMGLIPHVWDYDKVEEHNLCNQMFFEKHIEELKVNAIQEVAELSGGDIIPHEDKVVKGNIRKIKGIVFVLVDSMSSRKTIYEGLKMNVKCKLLIETRMGGKFGNIYTINPLNIHHCKEYEQTLYSDEEVVSESACGSSVSIFPTANIISNLAIWQFINYINEKEYSNDISINLEDLDLLEFKYKGGLSS